MPRTRFILNKIGRSATIEFMAPTTNEKPCAVRHSALVSPAQNLSLQSATIRFGAVVLLAASIGCGSPSGNGTTGSGGASSGGETGGTTGRGGSTGAGGMTGSGAVALIAGRPLSTSEQLGFSSSLNFIPQRDAENPRRAPEPARRRRPPPPGRRRASDLDSSPESLQQEDRRPGCRARPRLECVFLGRTPPHGRCQDLS
jgi:hypothetical protein